MFCLVLRDFGGICQLIFCHYLFIYSFFCHFFLCSFWDSHYAYAVMTDGVPAVFLDSFMFLHSFFFLFLWLDYLNWPIFQFADFSFVYNNLLLSPEVKILFQFLCFSTPEFLFGSFKNFSLHWYSLFGEILFSWFPLVL